MIFINEPLMNGSHGVQEFANNDILQSACVMCDQTISGLPLHPKSEDRSIWI